MGLWVSAQICKEVEIYHSCLHNMKKTEQTKSVTLLSSVRKLMSQSKLTVMTQKLERETSKELVYQEQKSLKAEMGRKT